MMNLGRALRIYCLTKQMVVVLLTDKSIGPHGCTAKGASLSTDLAMSKILPFFILLMEDICSFYTWNYILADLVIHESTERDLSYSNVTF